MACCEKPWWEEAIGLISVLRNSRITTILPNNSFSVKWSAERKSYQANNLLKEAREMSIRMAKNVNVQKILHILSSFIEFIPKRSIFKELS